MTPAQDIINTITNELADRDQQISQLTQDKAALETQITTLQTEAQGKMPIADHNAAVEALQQQINTLTLSQVLETHPGYVQVVSELEAARAEINRLNADIDAAQAGNA